MTFRSSAILHHKRFNLRVKKHRVRQTILRPFAYEPLRGRQNINLPGGNRRTAYSREIMGLRNALCMFAGFVGFLWLMGKLLLD